ncbi:MAG: type II secretion system F family protein [Candidatus Diapherotrites archaeon]|nr:type II secretion system F family protein [Candidatus Diapherotrites archaeon]
MEKTMAQLQKAARGLGWGDAGELVRHAAWASGGIFVAVFLAGGGLFCGLALLPLAAAYAVPTYFWARRQGLIEEELPQALYRAASNTLMPIEALVEELSEGDSPLAREFGKAHMQVANGVPVDEALEAMIDSNDSRLLKRAVGLVLQGYRTGANMGDALRETAEEISGVAEVVREQAATTAIEKYTLLLAGGVIVPLILGALVSMVGSLDFVGLADMGLGPANPGEMLASALLGSQFYIVEYAVLASLFVAYQENSTEKAIVYIAVLVPLSMALFMLARAVMFV